MSPEELENDFGIDLKRLFREAKTNSNPVSQRIVDGISEWLQSEIE